MFKRTGYFNPTGFRRTTLSPYAPVTPQQAANRFILEYVPSYVPPPPTPPAPVYVPNDNGGGGDGNVDPGGGHYGGFDHQNHDAHDNEHGHGYGQGPSSSHGGETGNMGPGGGQGSNSPGDNGNDGGHASEGGSGGGHGGGGYGGDGPDWSHGGTIPPMYANQGMVMPDMPEKEINSFQDLTGKLSTMTGIPSNIGTVTDQQKSSFDKGQAVGYTDKGYGMVMDALSAAPAMAKDYVEKEIDTAKENPLEAAVKALTNFGVTKAFDLKAFSPQAIVASAIINDIFDSQYSGLLDGPNSEVDMSANNTTGYTSNPSQMDASSHPSFGNIESIESVSPDIDAAINDIANEIDTPTTSSPPSTISDHANVHGPDPSPPSSQPPGIGPGPATPSYDGGMSPSPSYGSGMQDDGDFGGHPGMGGGSNSPGNDGGHTGGGAMDGSEAQSDGYGGLGHSKGGHIYASQGGYVNSTGGK